jgi:hypothetical protein
VQLAVPIDRVRPTPPPALTLAADKPAPIAALPEDTPMKTTAKTAAERHCTICGKRLRADNQHETCSACRSTGKTVAPVADAAPPDLGEFDVRALSVPQLLAAAAELKRRHAEAKELLRALEAA